MSIDRCGKCSALVDTDDEPESYVEVGNMRSQTETVCMCRNCREWHEDEQERRQSEPRQMPRDWQPTPEQQAFMDAAWSEADGDEDPAP